MYKKIPHVAAIHDLCGYGNCSLGVAKPILSAGGIEVCSVPTAFLSAHTLFPSYTFFDTTPGLEAFFEHWRAIDIPLDGAYSGFLGSTEQIDLIAAFFQSFPQMYIVVDPVMGDNGRIYPTYTPDMCRGMKKLARLADLLTPNLTEASVLLDRPYPGNKLNPAEAEEICDALLALGSKAVVLKGIERGDGLIVNCVKSLERPYSEHAHRLRPYKLHGTGDLFASLLTAAHFAGKDLISATEFAAELVAECIDLSADQPGFEKRGVSYEGLMHKISCALLGSPEA